MVTVGGKPILWRLMNYYASFGFEKFILCLGCKAEVIKNYVLNVQYFSNSLTVRYGQERRVGSATQRIRSSFRAPTRLGMPTRSTSLRLFTSRIGGSSGTTGDEVRVIA